MSKKSSNQANQEQSRFRQLKMRTPDRTQENIERIAKLFPNVITETRDENGAVKKAVDFDLLRQVLSKDLVEDDNERYRLDWPGKKASLLKANTPVTKTLRPCREESVNFDTTENLYIEGDNFEVLKILQESYLGKIKMIYIDPPYNTGNDFIYKDNFGKSKDEYEEELGTTDEEGGKLFRNTDTNGRYHSDWLSMMYERLLVARDLLKDDGVIFISIDDNEVHNLRKICDEIFGEENFLGNIIWNNVTDNNPTNIAIEHEYISVYSKSKNDLESIWKSNLSEIKDILVNIGNEFNAKFQSKDMLQNAYTEWYKKNKSQLGVLDRYKYIDEGGVYTGSQSVHNPGKEGYRYDILHPITKLPCKEPLMGYRFPKETMDKLLSEGKILFGNDHNKIIELKVYAKDYLEKLSSIEILDGRLGAYDIRQIFPELKVLFTNPKPVVLIEKYLSYILKDNDIILDFFSGSATTAHAVMQLNAEDGGNRKFIMVQLHEKTDENSEAFKAGYKTIADIGKERIRRAGARIMNDNLSMVNEKAKENPTIFDGHNNSSFTIHNSQLDIGFRVYKTDTTNMKDVFYHPSELKQDQLDLLESNIKEDRTPEDLLTQVILDLGLELTLPIETKQISGNTVFIVQTNSLVACFDNDIDFKIVDTIADLKPLKVVFKDASFKDDKDRINVEERFKRLSPETKVMVI